MKFEITFKTPDALFDAIDRETKFVGYDEDTHSFSENAYDLKSEVEKKIMAVAEKFVRHGQYITIEFDTDALTAVVKES